MILFPASVHSSPLPRCQKLAVRGRGRRGFTLTELIVVMAIIVLLAGAIVPALRGSLDGVNLAGSADNVIAQFSLARQTAMSRNLPVEVRICNRANGAATGWDTIALVIPALVSGKNVDEWIGTPTTLSGGVILDVGNSTGGSSFSTLISKALLNPIMLPAASDATAPWTPRPGTSATLLAAPGLLNKLTYAAFRFLPDGSTNLPSQDSSSNRQPWCLSVRNINTRPSPTGATPAVNYVALVIDPAAGRILTFRP